MLMIFNGKILESLKFFLFAPVNIKENIRRPRENYSGHKFRCILLCIIQKYRFPQITAKGNIFQHPMRVIFHLHPLSNIDTNIKFHIKRQLNLLEAIYTKKI